MRVTSATGAPKSSHVAARTVTVAVLVLVPWSGATAQTDTAAVRTSPHGAAPASGYTPHRVYDVGAGTFTDFESMAARAAAADVVFFGERHGHSPTHRLQHALLQALARRGGATLSMEMFERDVAAVVSGYVAGDVDHGTFLAESRPLARYFPDYHPLVEEARSRGWAVVAANVPRALANRIAQEGLAVLDGLEATERRHAAAEISCPDDDYRRRFVEEMTRHPSADTTDAEADARRQQRFYEAQCVKDETMAEAIAAATATGAARPVVHITGSFHSDYGDGIPVRLLRRAPDLDVVSVTIVTVADLDAADPAPHLDRADYLLFTLATPTAERPDPDATAETVPAGTGR
jgi:uncharacterized iron-regulated protein